MFTASFKVVIVSKRSLMIILMRFRHRIIRSRKIDATDLEKHQHYVEGSPKCHSVIVCLYHSYK